jgi:hypothetical protein
MARAEAIRSVTHPVPAGPASGVRISDFLTSVYGFRRRVTMSAVDFHV